VIAADRDRPGIKAAALRALVEAKTAKTDMILTFIVSLLLRKKEPEYY
jgi:hypothetical protein